MAVPSAAVLSLDCADPVELVESYAQMLDAESRPMTTPPDPIEIVAPGRSRVAFLRGHGCAPLSWPRPGDSQQAHLDPLVVEVVEVIDAAERQVVDRGARPLDEAAPSTTPVLATYGPTRKDLSVRRRPEGRAAAARPDRRPRPSR